MPGCRPGSKWGPEGCAARTAAQPEQPSRPNITAVGRSDDEELDAAGDVQLDAGDVPGEVGAEPGDRVGDVLRLAGPLEDGSIRDPLVHRRVRQVERLGPDDPGNDGVGGDAVLTAFHRERL